MSAQTKLENITIVTGACPFNAGGLAFQDAAPIHQCVFVPNNLHTVESRQAAFNFASSIERGCGSCSNVVLHGDENSAEVVWSGCGNVQAPIINRSLQGLETEDLGFINENGKTAHIILVKDASLSEVKSRFEAIYDLKMYLN
jgi:hypothetical protein